MTCLWITLSLRYGHSKNKSDFTAKSSNIQQKTVVFGKLHGFSISSDIYLTQRVQDFAFGKLWWSPDTQEKKIRVSIIQVSFYFENRPADFIYNIALWCLLNSSSILQFFFYGFSTGLELYFWHWKRLESMWYGDLKFSNRYLSFLHLIRFTLFSFWNSRKLM
jgi:hypothetical protein